MIRGDDKLKTIYLFRHSSPDKNSTLTNEFIPLSSDGVNLTKQLFNKVNKGCKNESNN